MGKGRSYHCLRGSGWRAIQTVNPRLGGYICHNPLENQPKLRGWRRGLGVGTQLLRVVSMSCSVENVRFPHQGMRGAMQ